VAIGAGPQGRTGDPPYLPGMTSTCMELQAAMNSCAGVRLSGVVRPGGEAIVVLAVGGTEIGRWPLAGSSRPDLEVIDELARLALTARRFGAQIGLREPGPELLSLMRFVGLDDVVVIHA
jgi:hypothetical protein